MRREVDAGENEDGEAASLYDKLENKIAPLYARPSAWAEPSDSRRLTRGSPRAARS